MEYSCHILDCKWKHIDTARLCYVYNLENGSAVKSYGTYIILRYFGVTHVVIAETYITNNFMDFSNIIDKSQLTGYLRPILNPNCVGRFSATDTAWWSYRYQDIFTWGLLPIVITVAVVYPGEWLTERNWLQFVGGDVSSSSLVINVACLCLTTVCILQ